MLFGAYDSGNATATHIISLPVQTYGKPSQQMICIVSAINVQKTVINFTFQWVLCEGSLEVALYVNEGGGGMSLNL